MERALISSLLCVYSLGMAANYISERISVMEKIDKGEKGSIMDYA